MCFNMVAVNPRHAKIIFDSLLDSMRVINDDGFSMWSYDPIVYIRTLDYEEFKQELTKVRRARLMHVHFRAASSGTVDIKNVHMWRIEMVDGKYYYVSHNGYVSKYASYSYFSNSYYDYYVYGRGRKLSFVDEERKREEEFIKSDTLQLVLNKDFQDAIFARDWDMLDAVLDEVGFYGVMFLTNPEEIIAVARGKPVHIHVSPITDILIFSNTDLRRNFGTVRKYGFTFSKPIMYTSLSDKVIVFDVRDMAVKETHALTRRQQDIHIYYGGYYIDDDDIWYFRTYREGEDDCSDSDGGRGTCKRGASR